MADVDWHDMKSDRCLAERGFDFAYAARIFDDETIEFVDRRKDYGEVRIVAFGSVDGHSIAVVYTWHDDVRWLISAFPCNWDREVKRWRRHDAGRRSAPAGSTSKD